MANIAWYLKRLRVMRPTEIVHRVSEQFRLMQMQLTYSWNGGRGPTSAIQWDKFGFCSSKTPQLPKLPWVFECDEHGVSRCLAGIIDALGYEWNWRDVPGVWHEAPDSGGSWPRRFFGSIPYRTGNPYGDIRVAWEPSRLQHLIDLSLIADAAGDQSAHKAVRLLERQFLSWCGDNPPWCGIHYISAMECGLRIIAAAYALDRVRHRLNDSTGVWSGYVQLVESHAHLIGRRLSLHSSTGNHTVAECAGLVYAGVLLPEFKGAARWLETGLSILVNEADHQILPDGGGVEQAFWYHVFVLDLYALVAELLTSRQLPVPRPIEGALVRGRAFLWAFGASMDDLPPFGDGDGGFALSKYLCLNWKGARTSETGLETFGNAGYSIIHSPRQSGLELLFDHGQLGMPPSFGHGHADALSVILRLGGKTLMTDPGTYTYTGDPVWRSYFRGTRAHNTVCVDHLDQAKQETAFLWSHPFQAELIKVVEKDDGSIILLARHNGYRHINVTHWRGVVMDSTGFVCIWDYLDGTGDHELELNWHIDASIRCINDGYIAECASEPVAIGIQGGELVVASGITQPIIGWKSVKYGHKQPVNTISSKYRGSVPHEFITVVVAADQFTTSLFNVDVVSEMRQWVR